MNQSPNFLLAALPKHIYEAVQPHLKVIEYTHGQILSEPGQSVDAVHFPHTGIVSLLVVLEVGDMIETAMVGRDGVLHGAAAMDGKLSLNRAIIQLPGYGSMISADRLVEIADKYRELRALLIRHEQVVLAQSQQSAACNATHIVEARLCRWLLRCRDLAGNDELLITQEFLAQMLGVRRSSVSVVASSLQRAGFIAYKRGRVRILDVEGLKGASCECYEAVRGHYARLVERRPDAVPSPADHGATLHVNPIEAASPLLRSAPKPD